MAFRLLTWNVQWCCGLDQRVDVARVAREALSFADPDVLCLQEVAVNYPGLPGGAGHDQPELLRELLPGYQVFYGPAVDEWSATHGRQQFGNLIASRWPLAQLSNHVLPYPADAGRKSMARSCLVATVQAPFGPVRVMTTHFEFYSLRQRQAQVRAVRALHAEACGQAAFPPQDDDSGWPFQNKVHASEAILCGDWNLEPGSAEHLAMGTAFDEPHVSALHDAWQVAYPGTPHAPTFQLHERRYRPAPITVDYLFVSEGLRSRVRRVAVDLQTRASDHQSVLLELA